MVQKDEVGNNVLISEYHYGYDYTNYERKSCEFVLELVSKMLKLLMVMLRSVSVTIRGVVAERVVLARGLIQRVLGCFRSVFWRIN